MHILCLFQNLALGNLENRSVIVENYLAQTDKFYFFLVLFVIQLKILEFTLYCFKKNKNHGRYSADVVDRTV